MTKKKVVEILKGLSCEIAQVQISFVLDEQVYNTNVLVYLVSDPSNRDQIIHANHLCRFYNIDEFDKQIKARTSTQIDFIMVSEFISDFQKKDDSANDSVAESENTENTIHWYKVKCSFFKEEFGVRKWDDLIDFMSHTIGFDYTITGQYTKPYTGVEGYYEDGHIIKI